MAPALPITLRELRENLKIIAAQSSKAKRAVTVSAEPLRPTDVLRRKWSMKYPGEPYPGEPAPSVWRMESHCSYHFVLVEAAKRHGCREVHGFWGEGKRYITYFAPPKPETIQLPPSAVVEAVRLPPELDQWPKGAIGFIGETPSETEAEYARRKGIRDTAKTIPYPGSLEDNRQRAMLAAAGRLRHMVHALQKAREQFDTFGRIGHLGVTRKGYRDREIEAEREVLKAAEDWIILTGKTSTDR